MIYKLWMFVCAAYMNDFYRDFRVDTSRHGSVPETTRQKVNIWGLLDGQFLRARPHDQQPFWDGLHQLFLDISGLLGGL